MPTLEYLTRMNICVNSDNMSFSLVDVHDMGGMHALSPIFTPPKPSVPRSTYSVHHQCLASSCISPEFHYYR